MTTGYRERWVRCKPRKFRLLTARRDWPHGTLDALYAGDRLAWDQFVQWSAPILHGAARRALQRLDRADVEDAVQDVFVRLCRDDFRLLRTFDPERGSLGTWLGVVAASTAIDYRCDLFDYVTSFQTLFNQVVGYTCQ